MFHEGRILSYYTLFCCICDLCTYYKSKKKLGVNPLIGTITNFSHKVSIQHFQALRLPSRNENTPDYSQGLQNALYRKCIAHYKRH